MLDSCPPLISMAEEIEAGNDFKWKLGVGLWSYVQMAPPANWTLQTVVPQSYTVHALSPLNGRNVARRNSWKRLTELA